MAEARVRVGLNISQEAAAKLDQLAETWGLSKTKALEKIILEAKPGK